MTNATVIEADFPNGVLCPSPTMGLEKGPINTGDTSQCICLMEVGDANRNKVRLQKRGLERTQKLCKCSISVSGELKSKMSIKGPA